MSKVCISKDDNKKSCNKKSKKKCSYDSCNKKLSLTVFPCRCKHRFCNIHRLPEAHACTYNYKVEDVAAFMKRVGLGGGKVGKIEVI